MITIGLDEFGHFDGKSIINFVGGYLYIGEDYVEERKRLYDFFKNICLTFNIKFPEDMHINRAENNRRQVQYFEEQIERPLKDYLKQNGKYHLVCMIKSKRVRNDFTNISNIADEKNANNLYENMICGLINNIVFNNIDIANHDQFRLEVPTRVSVVDKKDIKKLEEFKSLGYQGKEIVNQGKEEYRFYSTDQKTFKTALTARIMNSPKKNSKIFESLNVQSMDYENDREDMAFLYLADIICNCFKFRTDKEDQSFGIQKIHNWAESFTGGNQPYLWAYDDIDSIYSKVIEEYDKKNIVEMLEALYEGDKFDSDFIKYYQESWFNNIRNNIKGAFDINSLESYISKMDRFYTQSSINYDKGITIFNELWRMVSERESEISKAMRYKIADIGVRAYNHKGSVADSNPYYKICEDLKKNVAGVNQESMIATEVRKIQVYVNEFNFDKAIEKQQYMLDVLKMIKKTKIDAAELIEASPHTTKMVDLGRALSSLGQLYAFKRDKEALGYFKEALEEFEGDAGNGQITLSHILNFASNQGNRELYEKHAHDYFDKTLDLEEQLNSLMKKNNKDAFQFYTYVKAINNLYIDKVEDKLLDRLIAIDFESQGYCATSHPWQLIYKNIGIILYKKNRQKEASRYMQKALKCIAQPGDTIIAINHFTNIQKSFFIGKEKMLEASIEEFERWLNERPKMKEYFNDSLEGETLEIYEKLYSKFTFTYV